MWKEILENYKKLNEIPDPSNEAGAKKLNEEFQEKYNEITKWINFDDSAGGYYKYILINLLGRRILTERYKTEKRRYKVI